PSNAVLAVAGDIDADSAKRWIRRYFEGIEPGCGSTPGRTFEALQTGEKRFSHCDRLAVHPAVALAYRVPERRSRDYFAFALLDAILLQGSASRFNTTMVDHLRVTDRVTGGINYILGNMYSYRSDMLWTVWWRLAARVSASESLQAVDEVIAELQETLA